MIIIIPVIILSFFLESILSNFIAIDSSLLIPLFTIISLVIIFPFFNNNDLDYLKTCAIIGLCYDIIFTNTLIFNTIVFLGIGFLIKQINFLISNNPINIVLISSISIFVYRFITYFVLVIIGYFNYNFNTLLKGIYSSLLLNILYAVIVYIVTDIISRKYKIPKID